MSIDKKIIEDFGQLLNGIPKFGKTCRGSNIRRMSILSEKYSEQDYTAFLDHNYKIDEIREGIHRPKLKITFTDYSHLRRLIDNFSELRKDKWQARKDYQKHVTVRPLRRYLTVIRFLF